ncbi:phage major capsid protein [Clostridium pasteurianum]|uniref:phage major capsid protein n=1 Tax=Clostridium pasteurianum TaxID=1501 RepID=UPI002260CEC0|nr:phage major capsid protein [Clostridium pasteurianum]UZW13199.1 phage major capsid protein [Clostridium pasteurianum]
MKMNRYQLEQMLAGIGQDLKAANEKLANMYTDSKTTIESRNEQKNAVKDLEERFNGIKAQINEMDELAQKKMQNQNKIDNEENPKAKIIAAKAELIKATMTRCPVSNEIKSTLGGIKAAALGDGSTLGNGDKILPSTMTNELLTEPMAKNPLRGISTFTNITNLEVPKINFALDDDNFLESDSATAKELEADADTIVFGRNKFKVFCDITETVLNGTNTNLVAVVNAGLESGLAKKEKKVAFEATTPTDMSFYQKDGSSNYLIKAVEKDTLYKAIKACLADLEDDYSENAKIVMRKSDYFDMIDTLANGNATLYTAQPEQILGAPVVFCDLASIPVVGDFAYSHFNYDLNMLYDQDKNVKTGLNSFVITAWLDHKIKMKSAFRLATVTTTP